MKIKPWLKYVIPILAIGCFAPVVPATTQAAPAKATQNVQATDYDNFMRQGYLATAQRDYEKALINFRKALSLRQGNPYATKAINNISSYLSRRGAATISFVPPEWGAPGNRVGGATRGCFSGRQALTALVPNTNTGTTLAAQPTLSFYIPANKAEQLELVLLDNKQKILHKSTVASPKAPGIVSLDMAKIPGAPSLETGKNYQWYFSMICDPKDRSADVVVDGWIQRVEADPILQSEIQKAKPSDRVSLYAANGIWYDTVAAMVASRQSAPDNSVLTQEWSDLLKSVGLSAVAPAPIVSLN